MVRVVEATGVRYEIEHLIGFGANGLVYKAWRVESTGAIRQPVALKILKSRKSVALWRAEFESLIRITSRFCVKVFGFEWIDGKPTLVLEYIEGVSLAKLAAAGPLPTAVVDELVRQIKLGLEDLDRQGLHHGDLSPANVLVGRDGEVRLIDFGLGNSGGSCRQATPRFSAPDILNGRRPTLETDIFSLGQIVIWLNEQGGGAEVGTSEGPIRTPSEVLGERVRLILENEGVGRQMTANLDRQRSRARLSLALARLAVGLFVAMMGTEPQGQFQPSLQASSLSIRSQKWVRLSLDGRSVGFAPVDLFYLAPGRHLLQWEFADQKGERTLTLGPGEHIVLTESELR